MRCVQALVVVAVVLAVPALANGDDPSPAPPPDAEPPAEPPADPPADTEPPAEVAPPAPAPVIDWSAAPRPDQASGLSRRPSTPATTHLLWIPRVVLFLPRWAFWLAAQPIRLAGWAYEHYHIPDRFKRAAFNVDETFGIYPVAKYESQFGFQGGLRLVHKDLFGKRERLRVRANFGGRYRQAYGFTVATGDRFGKLLDIELDARYQRKPKEVFYGIGNRDELDAPPPMPIDPTVDDTAFESRYRENMWRAVLAADFAVRGPISARLSFALQRRLFAGDDYGDEASIEEVYVTDSLAGFADTVDTAYVEGELSYDTRRQTSIYQSRAIDSAGWFINAYFGGASGLGDDPTDYFRYGGEVQTFLDLYEGSRVLALRVLVEQVGGTTIRDGHIALPDLPRLGGVEYLRGYPDARFRDKAMTLGTAEYTWDLGNFLAAFAFVDVGRVWPSLRDFELEDFRVGFGGGIQIHSRASFFMRAQVSASRDGDLFFELALSPVFGRRERVGKFY